MEVRPRRRRLQSGANSQAAGSAVVSRAITPNAIGKWRIVETDPWDAQYLHILKPAFIAKNGSFSAAC
jgi:hypothetical protein